MKTTGLELISTTYEFSGMSTSMKALVYRGPGKIAWESKPLSILYNKPFDVIFKRVQSKEWLPRIDSNERPFG